MQTRLSIASESINLQQSVRYRLRLPLSHLRGLQPEWRSGVQELGFASLLLPRLEPKENQLLETKTESGPGKEPCRTGLDKRSVATNKKANS